MKEQEALKQKLESEHAKKLSDLNTQISNLKNDNKTLNEILAFANQQIKETKGWLTKSSTQMDQVYDNLIANNDKASNLKDDLSTILQNCQKG